MIRTGWGRLVTHVLRRSRLVIDRFVEFLFEELTWPEVGLSASGNVDDLPGSRVSGGRLGTRLLDLKDTEPADFDSSAVDQALAHRLEHDIDHFRTQILLASGLLTDLQGQVFLGRRRQNIPPCKGTEPGMMRFN